MIKCNASEKHLPVTTQTQAVFCEVMHAVCCQTDRQSVKSASILPGKLVHADFIYTLPLQQCCCSEHCVLKMQITTFLLTMINIVMISDIEV